MNKTCTAKKSFESQGIRVFEGTTGILRDNDEIFSGDNVKVEWEFVRMVAADNPRLVENVVVWTPQDFVVVVA